MDFTLDTTIPLFIIAFGHFIPTFLLIQILRAPEKQTFPTPAEASIPLAEPTVGWSERLKLGLSKSRAQLAKAQMLFQGKTYIDENLLEQLHETLYRCDLGPSVTDDFIDHIRQTSKGSELDYQQVMRLMQQRSHDILSAPSQNAPHTPSLQVILMVGVNGAGKTTTTGKLAAKLKAEGKSVILGAADTFRAAASEQLEEWGKRTGAEVVRHTSGSDPAAVACDCIRAAIARQHDVAIIDTAGRLHNKTDLMNQLQKVKRVIEKECPGAPHETWLVLDATTGQNALPQVQAFKQATPLTGVIMTKLDGTAKGGALISVTHQHKIPVKFIGVGESADDLQPFRPQEFSESLFPA
ncbi:MAG: signal recognition particle-docking protein FtsY [Oligoflexales bacterium]